MDARSRSFIGPDSSTIPSFSVDPSTDIDDDFPTDLPSAPECTLVQLCDALFLELDSEMPDLRAMERYQSVCDELTARQTRSGVA